eukprot:CAMPEP_0202892418 /NCGR_PEP_ID=MMETSP1392-20130828/2138_1 /ASSEMBLY_ACC=CAM_ASM_000868 /TAXON_ID=225041 /ORGANISM="Chlamydomonas chlamydogama, Strain SAG 11-48b" /LENGTH=124 /DNA_ID=CAMNT_0049576355 /DNA_START=502 /DNA_END=876 /DNA_ORIENTATION=+
MASILGMPLSLSSTRGRARYLDTRNAAAAPSVDASDTRAVPLRGPNSAPAARVSTEAGNRSTVATTYSATNMAAAVAPEAPPSATASSTASSRAGPTPPVATATTAVTSSRPSSTRRQVEPWEG